MSTGGFEFGRVLVVDDEPIVRYLLEIVLVTDGWHVEQATSGEEALARCKTESFDVVILDHWLPGATGLEVAEQLIGDGFRTPIVIFSGFLEPELEVAGREIGAEVIDKLNWKELLSFCDAMRYSLTFGRPEFGVHRAKALGA